MLSLIFSALHEFGHLTSLIYYGKSPDSIIFYGAGIKICSELSGLDRYRKIIVLLCGCSVNVIIAIIAVFSGNMLTASINIIMVLFNLLPIGYLDGAQILRVCLEKNYHCDSIMRFISITFAVVLLIAIISLHSINISITLTVSYIIFMMVYY